MCRAWVLRWQKTLQAPVCKEALDWETAVVEKPSQSSDAGSSSKVDEGAIGKQAKTRGVLEHGASFIVSSLTNAYVEGSSIMLQKHKHG